MFNLQPSPQLHPHPQLKQQLSHYFLETFNCYQSLFECVSASGLYEKAISLRHPLIFYYGHTATFFVNKLLLAKLIEQRINPHFESIFAVGVDEMSWDDLDDTHYQWPTFAEVTAYREEVKATVLEVIEQANLEQGIDWDSPYWAIMMGIEHERIHLETSSVLIRQQKLDYVRPNQKWPICTLDSTAPINQWVDIAAGTVNRNKSKQDGYYGWDNEYGQHQAQLEAFQVSRYLVSNQEFLAFVEAGGYSQPQYWLEEGQAWLAYSQAQAPCFWQHVDGQWLLRLMTQRIEMPWSWPVEVNYHEAKAFCQWKSTQTGQSIRLPTEDEWQRLYDLHFNEPAHLSLQHYASACPVDQFAHGELFDVMGNVWQWTETPIYPYQGFAVHPLYDDFSTPTFDQRHNLIKGGSWISAGNEARAESRYAFRRHFFQHAGFRYVNATPLAPIRSHYEHDDMVSQYLEFQYGATYFQVANFAQHLVQLAQQYFPAQKRSALDIGCATGRASFELAQHFEQVTAIDFSVRFIQHAVQLQQGQTLHYHICTEGDLTEYKSCDLASFGLTEVADKVSFSQGDACNLKPQFTGYDFILAANLIDRLHHPQAFLSTIHQRLATDGILMLTSPYTWLAEHTEPHHWIGGFKKDAESISTLQGLHHILDAEFELLDEPRDVEFVIRETARKFQHSIAQVTLWRKRH